MRESIDGTASLQLLGGFAFRVAGVPVEIPRAGQRVLAFVALAGGAVNRSVLAGNLWPDRTEGRALANLRGVVWRLPQPVQRLLRSNTGRLALTDSLDIDVDSTFEAAAAIRSGGATASVDRLVLLSDLLPDWDDDDWLTIARERHRQLRLHALEELAAAELAAGRPLDAVDTALCAVAVEPLRESAQMLVLRAHLAAGNRADALEHYHRVRELLCHELALDPSRQMVDLMSSIHGDGDAGVTMERVDDLHGAACR